MKFIVASPTPVVSRSVKHHSEGMRGHAAQRLFRATPCRKGAMHLSTSMPSPEFEPKPYGTTVSVTNHYTGKAVDVLSILHSNISTIFGRNLNE
ncbi:hypothetical protein TNCV_3979131 [Trichonephila clavipes]|nr:hypothetical protein TNCV_3979131 [Trichonephila clavipes]